MPELPEVEVVRTSLEPALLKRRIKNIRIFWHRSVHPLAPQEFIKKVVGQKIIKTDRLGKYMFWKLNTGDYVIIHLRMTGQFLINQTKQALPLRHERVRFELDRGTVHFFDQRKFGRIGWVSEKQLFRLNALAKLGWDALDKRWTAQLFAQQVGDRKSQIKPLLLGQQVIAGLGNIYVDEALFLSGIHPVSLSDQIPKESLRQLFKNIQKVLKQSIRYQGTTFRDYRTARGETGGFFSKLWVYGRAQQACRQCGASIKKIKVAQRGTHICLKCQKKY